MRERDDIAAVTPSASPAPASPRRAGGVFAASSCRRPSAAGMAGQRGRFWLDAAIAPRSIVPFRRLFMGPARSQGQVMPLTLRG